MRIWVDGSGFNGREARYCVLFENGDKIVERTSVKQTNNTMEYMALLAALRKCSVGDTIYTDSQLVFGQMTDGWNINYDHLKRLNELAKDLMEIKRANLVWIPREKNRAGKILDHVLDGTNPVSERGKIEKRRDEKGGEGNGSCREHAEEKGKA